MRKIKRALELNINYFLRRRTPVIVYSMQRTGTVAIFRSLTSHGEFALATHCLDQAKINTGCLSGSAKWACKHIITPRKKAKIISLVRNPIDNMMSVFARTQLASNTSGPNLGENDLSSLLSEDLVQRFIAEYFQSDRYLHQLEWFDSEFKAALGIDAYDYPFDKQQGYVQSIQ